MKVIRSDRRSDTLRRKQEYDNTTKQIDEELDDYRSAMSDVYDAVKEIVQNKISDTSLSLDVDVSSKLGALEVRVKCTSDLKWSWYVSFDMDDGYLIKDLGRWPNLSEIYPNQLDTLKESTRIVDLLNSIDWYQVLNVELPKYTDYVKTQVPEYENFDEELAELEE